MEDKKAYREKRKTEGEKCEGQMKRTKTAKCRRKKKEGVEEDIDSPHLVVYEFH